jgi:hypothetical protein
MTYFSRRVSLFFSTLRLTYVTEPLLLFLDVDSSPFKLKLLKIQDL